MALGMISAGLNQSAANKGPRPLFSELQSQGLDLLKGFGTTGGASLTQFMQTGAPTDTSQVFNSLANVNRLQLQQSTAQLRERFGAQGLSSSSPAAVGESNLLAQNTADFMNILSQYTFQAQESARQRQLAATEFGLNAFLGPAFTDIGPKGSVAGAVLGSAQDQINQLALAAAMGGI